MPFTDTFTSNPSSPLSPSLPSDPDEEDCEPVLDVLPVDELLGNEGDPLDDELLGMDGIEGDPLEDELLGIDGWELGDDGELLGIDGDELGEGDDGEELGMEGGPLELDDEDGLWQPESRIPPINATNSGCFTLCATWCMDHSPPVTGAINRQDIHPT